MSKQPNKKNKKVDTLGRSGICHFAGIDQSIWADSSSTDGKAGY